MKIQHLALGKGHPLVFILGPCVIEDHKTMLQAAKELAPLFEKYPCIFKSSFDKANRSSVDSYRGPGLEAGLDVLREIKEQFGFLVTTDVHEVSQIEHVSEVCDLLQIPAFLCRQTDLLLAAGKSGRPVHVKKGQFLAPEDIKQIIEKLHSVDCTDILITERGTFFGYHSLVNDMRSIPIIQRLGAPVCFDMTHSVQRPTLHTSHSGGDVQFARPLARAAIAAGANALFLETHPSPKQAKCDRDTQLDIDSLESLLSEMTELHAFIQKSYV